MMYRISPFLRRFALALLCGIGLATLWANLWPAGYYDFIEWRIADPNLPDWIWAGTVTLTPFMVVTDMLMALFFFFIGKELWEALVLERGSLSGRRAGLPLGLSIGGMIGAAAAWLTLSALIETAEEAVPGGGWTVPLGSDTVLIYLFARMAFGRGHPALHLTILMAISTDILALLVLGLSNPNLSVRLVWLALPLLAAVVVGRLFGRRPSVDATERRRLRGQRLWPYLLAGAVSWFGTAASGMPASLGLLPIIPAIARAERSFGLFAEAEGLLNDPLNRLTRAIMWPLTAILFLFGLIRGGVDLLAFAPTTAVTLGALWIGRPLGLALAALVLISLFGNRLPRRVGWRHLAVIAPLMAIGFSVPAVAIGAALPGGAMAEAARAGLVLSLLAGPAALLLARILKV
ncbi:Na+/H+ antiporter NhaA [Pseudogemmobacter sonorensis]|uniref:Na+/H+ antiporter NhaA n=1 Tax=Pseudogemmobacter sonorensis TaxID=2989681 RepID=UPI0036800A3F